MKKEKIKKICDSLDEILDVLDLEKPKWNEFPTDVLIIKEIVHTIGRKIATTLMRIGSDLEYPQEKNTIIETVKHYTEGAFKAAKAMTLPETEESKARLAVCHGCNKWTGTSCKVCGCFVNLKVKIPEEKCPEGKW